MRPASVAILCTTAVIIGSGDAFQSPASRAALQRDHLSTTLYSSVVADTPPTPISTSEPTIASIDTQSSSASETPQFNWFKAWYPLVPIEFLDYEKPHAFKLLGMDVVIWNDGPLDINPAFKSRKERMKGAKKLDGEWRVFVDQCPHRKGKLFWVGYLIF